jgi:hypothetical protein
MGNPSLTGEAAFTANIFMPSSQLSFLYFYFLCFAHFFYPAKQIQISIEQHVNHLLPESGHTSLPAFHLADFK